MAKRTSLILTIAMPGVGNDIILTNDLKTQDVKLTLDATNAYRLSIQDLSYSKQMYAPGEINVELQMELKTKNWERPSKSAIENFFRNRKVTLQYGNIKYAGDKWDISDASTICDGYYIYKAEPRYKSDCAFVSLKIYSPDKLLTDEQTCKSWVARRLGRDILETEIPKHTLPYGPSSAKLAVDYSHFRNLAVDSIGDEIHPYLVQYNESFYDFLVRTANRWGEFMYYENNKLNFGYVDKVKNISTFDNLTYCNIGEQAISEIINSKLIGDGVTHPADILNNPLKKDKYDAVKNALGCSLKDGGDIWTAKLFGNLFSSGKNLYDFVVDTVVDEGIALGQIKTRVSNNNKKFEQDYFTIDEKEHRTVQYGTDEDGNKTFNQFSSASPIITSDKYKTILSNEIDTAKDAICISFDTAYQDIHLGDIITIQGGDEKYIVVKAYSQKDTTMAFDPESQTIVNEEKTTFHIMATAQVSGQFYPTVHPKGHVRKSGPQLAVVKKPSLEDPIKQLRVRVQFPWQSGDDITPWLAVAHPGSNKSCGSYNRHYVDENVIVGFADENLERPYVLGSLSLGKQTPPASAHLNDIVHVSPGGQSVKIGDGTGSGFTQFMAGFNPGLKLIKGFFPGSTLSCFDFEDSKSFEGGVELADKYGMYSIKGSTDGRNVTIKSPYGDVKLSAFTGITISAPNGDVKIAGKNVTIEAGNNLTLTSGKNVKDGFWLSYQDKDLSKAKNWGLTMGAAVTKKLATLVGGFVDVTILRSALEVFMRPIEGKLTVKSNRYLALEAGSGKTGYPVDAYWKPDNHAKWGVSSWRSKGDVNKQTDQDNTIRRQFDNVAEAVRQMVDAFCHEYIEAKRSIRQAQEIINRCTKIMEGQRTLPCKEMNAITDNIWSNSDIPVTNDTVGFAGMLNNVNTADDMTDEMIRFFVTSYNPNGMQEDKAAKREQAFEKHQDARMELKTELEIVRTCIRKMKSFSHTDYLELFDDDTARNALSKDGVINGTLLKTLPDNDDFKEFTRKLTNISTEMMALKKKLNRKYYVMLVDAYNFKREKIGAIKGIGGSVPPAPDPMQDNIESAWLTYVNSIQSLPKIKKATKSKLMDFAQNNFLDALIKQNGLLDAVNDARDNYAFGQGSKGRILFSNGGDTMILDEDIMRANTDNVGDVELSGNVESFASKIRSLMLA